MLQPVLPAEPALDSGVMGVAHETAEGFFSLSPRRVAVVMVDFQNNFCSPEVFSSGPVTNTGNAETA